SFQLCEQLAGVNFIQDVSIVILIAIIDVITIIKYRISSAEAAKATCQKKRNADKNLLRQTVVQGVVFAVELSTYFYFSFFFQNKWIIWTLTTVAWNLVHFSDAVIIIAFNKEFRRLICSPFLRLWIKCTNSSRVFAIDGVASEASQHSSNLKMAARSHQQTC
ncbi:hypothetical protein OSTOST_05946, partial [Ostertagia ostertagi]